MKFLNFQFSPISSVSIVEFELGNISWVVNHSI